MGVAVKVDTNIREQVEAILQEYGIAKKELIEEESVNKDGWQTMEQKYCADFFETVRDDLVKEHRGEYVIVHDGAVISFHESAPKAVHAAREKFKGGEFIVKWCVPKSEEKVVYLRSRAGI